MPKVTLTAARIEAFRSRETTYDVQNVKLRGFGVRVSFDGGRRFFVLCQHRGERIWKIIGDAGSIGVGEARSLVSDMLAATRGGEEALHSPDDTAFEAVEAVAKTVFEGHAWLWKPGTLAMPSVPVGFAMAAIGNNGPTPQVAAEPSSPLHALPSIADWRGIHARCIGRKRDGTGTRRPACLPT